MLITKRELMEKKSIDLSSTTEITSEDLKQIQGFISLDKMSVKVHVNYVDGMDLAIVKLSVLGTLTMQSTRTLKPVKFNVKDQDEITYSFSDSSELEDDSIIQVDKDEIELHDQIISVIVTSLPIKIVGKDEPECFEEDNWEVISEDEYNRRSQSAPSPFDVLKDMDFDDED